MSTLDANKVKNVFNDSRLPINGTVVLFAVLIGLWQLVSLFYPVTLFPGILELVEALGRVFSGNEQFGFWNHTPITIARIFLAVGISMAIGVPLGIAMGINRGQLGFFRFYLLVVLTVPSIMWAFLGVTWFGITTYLVPLFGTVLALLPYVMINVWKGTEAVDPDLMEMTDVFGLSRRDVWRNVYVPHLLPYLFSTTRMVFSLSWRIMISVEIFGSQSGLGFVLNGYFLQQQNHMLLAWSIPVFLLMFGIERVLQRVEQRKFAWRDSAEQTQAAGA